MNESNLKSPTTHARYCTVLQANPLRVLFLPCKTHKHTHTYRYTHRTPFQYQRRVRLSPVFSSLSLRCLSRESPPSPQFNNSVINHRIIIIISTHHQYHPKPHHQFRARRRAVEKFKKKAQPAAVEENEDTPHSDLAQNLSPSSAPSLPEPFGKH